jgi:hypothetical protein
MLMLQKKEKNQSEEMVLVTFNFIKVYHGHTLFMI